MKSNTVKVNKELLIEMLNRTIQNLIKERDHQDTIIQTFMERIEELEKQLEDANESEKRES